MKIKWPITKLCQPNKTRSPPTPPKQMCAVSPQAMKEQERVEETSLVIGRVTVAAKAVAGGGREARRAGPGGTSDFGE